MTKSVQERGLVEIRTPESLSGLARVLAKCWPNANPAPAVDRERDIKALTEAHRSARDFVNILEARAEKMTRYDLRSNPRIAEAYATLIRQIEMWSATEAAYRNEVRTLRSLAAAPPQVAADEHANNMLRQMRMLLNRYGVIRADWSKAEDAYPYPEIILETPDIVLERGGAKFKLGTLYMCIRFPLIARGLYNQPSQWAYAKPSPNSVFTNTELTDGVQYYHPHVEYTGRICLGAAGPTMATLMRSGAIFDAVLTLDTMLSGWNDEDAGYARLDAWNHAIRVCKHCNADIHPITAPKCSITGVACCKHCDPVTHNGRRVTAANAVEYKGKIYAATGTHPVIVVGPRGGVKVEILPKCGEFLTSSPSYISGECKDAGWVGPSIARRPPYPILRDSFKRCGCGLSMLSNREKCCVCEAYESYEHPTQEEGDTE